MKKLIQSLFILLLVISTAIAQDKTVTGTVTSKDDGAPLPGVSVEVKGTKIATQTSLDGKYSINMPSGSTQLVFSYIGFISKTVTVSGRTANVSMDTDNKQLSEVVVVAYGTSKKEAITGSVATLGATAIENRVVTNITNILQGLAPGIQVNGASGQPGNSAAVRIRGFGSISASNSPLYVLDGSVYDGNIGDINPNDIETVSLLKDASSSALYGARGANGVIIITTKKGKLGEPQLSLNLNQGFSERGIPEYDRVGTLDYYPAAWQALRNSLVYPRSGTGATPAAAATSASNTIQGNLLYNPFNVPNNQIVGTDGRLNPNASLLYNDFDWYAPLQRTSSRTDLNSSISGRTGKSDYYISLGYLDDKGFIERTDFRRLTGRINVNSQVKSWLKTGLNLGSNLSDGNLAATGASSFVNVFNFARGIAPIYPVRAYDATGAPIIDPATGQQFYDYGEHPGAINRPSGGAASGRNIVYETLLNDIVNRRVALNARTYAEIKFLKDFTFRPSFSIDMRNAFNDEFRNPIVGDGAGFNGLATRSSSLTKSYTLNQILSYTKNIQKHNFDVLVGHENYDLEFTSNNSSKVNQILAGNTQLANFVTPQSAGGSQDVYRIESYFSKASYNYDEKYFFDASLRRDGSSRFSTKSRYGTFYSLGGSWSISKENFMKDVSWVNDLRLKASYGEVGNDALLDGNGNNSYYNYQAFYDLGWNNGNQPGILLATAATPELKWETVNTLNIGVAFSLLDNRLTGELEVFNRGSRDLLFAVPQPLSDPVTTIRKNVGTMTNKGIELQLGGDIIRTQNFNWNLLTNWSVFKNEITKLPEETPTIVTGTKRYEKGQDIYQFWLRQYAGVDPADGTALYVPQEGQTTGLRTVEGVDYVIDANNAKFAYSGSAIPDLFGAFTNTFRYKDLQLSFLVNYQIGGKFYDSVYQGLMGFNYGSALHADILNSWTETNTQSQIPRLDAASTTFHNATSSRWLVDASYISLTNVNLSYNLPKKLISKVDLRGARLFMSGENLGLISYRKGLSPIESFNGLNGNTFLPSRVLSFGLGINL
ncbi:SusC/RagA family TonB-linked outer membrane protein [Pedobacter alpinus]|uniref:SusC/RagA family TonB-linked outer membrane protein n=1 Tax=Pedobacter alpinus TaxID=1590643 RepID=A0ABW5TRC9_9SPHI